MTYTQSTFSTNNFNLIRLLAALEVILYHGLHHLNFEYETWKLFYEFLKFFPGVPIFFFISGFLISKSFEGSSTLSKYAKKRLLRIYPALIVCIFISLFSVYLVGYFDGIDLGIFDLIKWVVAQATFLQFYNPEFMRGYGVGVLNGSLWTISVELQFYLLTPILYAFFKIVDRKNINTLLIILIIIFMSINMIYNRYEGVYGELLIVKLFQVSFLPWFYMFLVGVFFQRNFIFIYKKLSGKLIYISILYFIFIYIFMYYFDFSYNNRLNPIYFILVAIFTFTFAYSYCNLSDKILGNNDISYGVYIYHMPVINLVLYLGFSLGLFTLFSVVITTIIVAFFSWTMVEKKALKLKK